MQKYLDEMITERIGIPEPHHRAPCQEAMVSMHQHGLYLTISSCSAYLCNLTIEQCLIFRSLLKWKDGKDLPYVWKDDSHFRLWKMKRNTSCVELRDRGGSKSYSCVFLPENLVSVNMHGDWRLNSGLYHTHRQHNPEILQSLM